jgi:hypothetical protein
MIRFASTGMGGALAMRRPSKKKEWPQYSRGPKESLHAMAVLILNFNAFETALFRLFAHHLVDDGAAFKLATKMFFALPERNRLDFIKMTFSSREKDTEVKLTVSKLLKYFEWCQHTRNHFAHARYDPSLFKTSQDDTHLFLAKRGQRYGPKPHYMKPSLRMLRNAADKVNEGLHLCLDLCLFLELRDIPLNEQPIALRALRVTDGEPPEIPSPPKKMRKSLIPHTPPMPPHLRKVRGGSKRSLW